MPQLRWSLFTAFWLFVSAVPHTLHPPPCESKVRARRPAAYSCGALLRRHGGRAPAPGGDGPTADWLQRRAQAASAAPAVLGPGSGRGHPPEQAASHVGRGSRAPAVRVDSVGRVR